MFILDAIHNFHPQYRDYTQYNAHVRFLFYFDDLYMYMYMYIYQAIHLDTELPSVIFQLPRVYLVFSFHFSIWCRQLLLLELTLFIFDIILSLYFQFRVFSSSRQPRIDHRRLIHKQHLMMDQQHYRLKIYRKIKIVFFSIFLIN